MSNESKNGDLNLNHRTTALVLIDLQKQILSMPLVPYSSVQVVAKAAALANRCRTLGIPVVLVTVDFRPDSRDRLSNIVDSPLRASVVPVPDGAMLAPELKADPADILVVKHQWGAFYGTDLDLQLRRRGIDTILIGGVATNFGVESTARDAWERNYKVVFIEDAMSTVTAEAHTFAVSLIFPRIGRVRSSTQILEALS